MSPVAVLTGISFRSAVTIGTGLAMVPVVFLTMSGEQPALARECGSLLKSFFLFLALAFVSGYAYVGVLRQRRWRCLAQPGSWLVPAALAACYWPK